MRRLFNFDFVMMRENLKFFSNHQWSHQEFHSCCKGPRISWKNIIQAFFCFFKLCPLRNFKLFWLFIFLNFCCSIIIKFDFGSISLINSSYFINWVSFEYPILNHKSWIMSFEIYKLKYFFQTTLKSVILKYPSSSESKHANTSLKFISFAFCNFAFILSIFFSFFMIVASNIKKFFLVSTSTSANDFICLFFSMREKTVWHTSNIVQNELKSIFPYKCHA